VSGRPASIGLVERVARPDSNRDTTLSVVGRNLPTAPLAEESGAAGSPLRVRAGSERGDRRTRGYAARYLDAFARQRARKLGEDRQVGGKPDAI